VFVVLVEPGASGTAGSAPITVVPSEPEWDGGLWIHGLACTLYFQDAHCAPDL